MKNRDQSAQAAPKDDITQQHYRGASPVVAGLGESVVHGKFLLITGILLGGIAGALFPTPVGKAMDEARTAVSKWQESKNHLLHGIGGTFKWLLNIGESVVTFFRRMEPVENTISKMGKTEKARERVARAIDGAIVTSSVLSAMGFITGFFSGTRHSATGKNQFQQAKNEIVSLREQNTQLRNKLIETQFTLDDFKTADAARHGSLSVAKDPTPKMEAPSPVINATQANLQDAISTLSADDLARTN